MGIGHGCVENRVGVGITGAFGVPGKNNNGRKNGGVLF